MIITQDGRYFLKPTLAGDSSSRMVVYLSGSFGTAEIMLQYRDELDQYIDLENGDLPINTQSIVEMGDVPIFLNVVGSNQDTNLSVMVRSIL